MGQERKGNRKEIRGPVFALRASVYAFQLRRTGRPDKTPRQAEVGGQGAPGKIMQLSNYSRDNILHYNVAQYENDI